MAQSGYTPILIYASGTASNVPSASNLTNSTLGSELALNYADGKLYYKDNSGVVQVMASKATAAGTFTSISDSGNLALTGTGNRITGDFTNATVANRVMFQTSTSNSATVIGVIPSGTGTASYLALWGNASATNTNVTQLGSDGSIASGQVGSGTYLPMTFYTGGAERMRLDTSGRLGIGTSTPSTNAILTTNGSISVAIPTRNAVSSNQIGVWTSDDPSDNARSSITFATTAGASSSNSYIAFSTNNYGVSGGERMRIDSDGLVGIGMLGASTVRLSVAASSAFIMVGRDSTGVTDQFRIAANGNVTNTNNSYAAISDIKIKENVVDATPKLSSLMKVRIVNYNLKSNLGYEQNKQIGVIAQELEQIFPSLVEETADLDVDGTDLKTSTKSVKYSVFVPILIKAIQEQQALIQDLTTRLAALEAK